MTTTSILSDTIMAQAAAFKEARSQFDRQFNVFTGGIPPLAPEHFWPMAAHFREVVVDTMRYTKKSVGKKAAEEFLRLAVVNGGDLAAAVHFALSWRHYSRDASAAGDNCRFSFDRGDDSYGDLMDALPLMGQSLHEMLGVGSPLHSLQEFNNEVDRVCDVAGRVLKDVVLYGENYFATSLEDAAKNWVVIESRNYGKGGE